MFLHPEFGFKITYSTLAFQCHDFRKKFLKKVLKFFFFYFSSSPANETHKGANDKITSVIWCSQLNVAAVIVG